MSVVVTPGESFWSIGQRFHVGMTDLAAFNGMTTEETLDVGVTLRIPRPDWTAPAVTTSAVTTTPAAPAAAPVAAAGAAPAGVWACIANAESGGNPAEDTGNGYYGMYQFSLGTWAAAGGEGNPADASAAEQTAVAERVQAMQGWGAWPVTSQLCGV